MGWLEDLSKTTIYNYRNQEDREDLIQGTSTELSELFCQEVKGEPGEVLEVEFENGEKAKFEYSGFEPHKVNIMYKTTFEKNGRKGVRVSTGDGKSHVRSMTRENLYKGEGVNETGMKRDAKGELTGEKSYEVDSALTKGCREASDKAKTEMLRSRLQGFKKQVSMQNAKRRKK
jgi:hypothetical protein